MWINEVKTLNMNMEVPMEIVNSLNEIIQESAPSAMVEVMRQEVKELSQVVHNDQFVTNSFRGLVVDLQEKFDVASPQGALSPSTSGNNLSPPTSLARSPQMGKNSRNRDELR